MKHGEFLLIALCVAAAVLFGGLWVQAKERAAVARAELVRFADSSRTADSVRTATALAAAQRAREAAELQAIRRREAEARAAAATALAGALAGQLRTSLDSAQGALLDSLEAAHLASAASLAQAVAHADSEAAKERAGAEELKAALLELRRSNAELAAKLRVQAPPQGHLVRRALTAAACVAAGWGAGEQGGRPRSVVAALAGGTGCVLGSLGN